MTDEDIVSRMKIKMVKDQILDSRDNPVGELSILECPYCGSNNYEGNMLCCDTLRTCVVTILMGLRQEKIEEKTGGYVN